MTTTIKFWVPKKQSEEIQITFYDIYCDTYLASEKTSSHKYV